VRSIDWPGDRHPNGPDANCKARVGDHLIELLGASLPARTEVTV
jgi:hypothetical protein